MTRYEEEDSRLKAIKAKRALVNKTGSNNLPLMITAAKMLRFFVHWAGLKEDNIDTILRSFCFFIPFTIISKVRRERR